MSVNVAKVVIHVEKIGRGFFGDRVFLSVDFEDADGEVTHHVDTQVIPIKGTLTLLCPKEDDPKLNAAYQALKALK